ncbi:MAG: ribonuclease H-like YkuK family protein, partial [Patescibacteria group bacterium]
MKDVIFHGSRGDVSFDEIIADIICFVERDPQRFYKVIIGSDSRAVSSAALVTAVTVWRVGNGAIHFWTKAPERVFYTMQERIWQEAIASITLAQEI